VFSFINEWLLPKLSPEFPLPKLVHLSTPDIYEEAYTITQPYINCTVSIVIYSRITTSFTRHFFPKATTNLMHQSLKCPRLRCNCIYAQWSVALWGSCSKYYYEREPIPVSIKWHIGTAKHLNSKWGHLNGWQRDGNVQRVWIYTQTRQATYAQR
jgi:hypothetical protein